MQLHEIVGDNAKTGDDKAVKLFLQLTKEIDVRVKVKVKVKNNAFESRGSVYS